VRTAVLWTTIILNVVAMLGMVVTILMHSGRGGGLSDMFGGASGTALGSTAAERNLTRITVVLTVIWCFTVVGLGLLMT
jgi:preprotein translocase subunit SecG